MLFWGHNENTPEKKYISNIVETPGEVYFS